MSLIEAVARETGILPSVLRHALESDAVKEALAEAWSEGYTAGWRAPNGAINPYRATA